MSAPNLCPGPDQLSDFHRGALGPDALDAVGEHVSVCPECEARLAALDAGNDVVSNLRRFLDREPRIGPDEYRGLERKAKAIPIGPITIPYDRPTVAADFALPANLGKYRLTEELGRGGMGVVYAAFHTRLNKRVAVKVILPEYVDHPRVVARFRREALAIGELGHPNIVAATDADEADGCPFLVMELVDGLDLASVLRRVGPLPVADACELIRQAAVGLQYVHERGRVHRDLKPSNLMLATDGVVKILDLGLAVLREDGQPAGPLTGSRLMMGTADYTAPEQWADSHRVDIRADVYSLGCTLYHLLVGRPPFGEHASTPRKQLAHAEAPPPSARLIRPDIPTEVDDILQRMLAKRPDDRFPTPQAVADALRPFTTGANGRQLLVEATQRSTHHWLGDGAAETDTYKGRTRVVSPREARGQVRSSRKRLWGIVGGFFVAAVAWIFLWPANPAPEGGAHNRQPTSPSTDGETPKLRPNVVHDLLRQEPTEVLWLNQANNHHRHLDPGGRQLWVTAPSLALLGLGKTEHPGYRVRLGMGKTGWKGGRGVGLFFGCHKDVVDGVSCLKYQALEFRPFKGGNEAFILERCWGAVRPGGPPPYVLQEAARAGVPFPQPADGEECTLEIEVKQFGLAVVKWNGQALPELVRPGLNQSYSAADYAGEFGALCRMDSCRFSNSQLTIFERRN